MNEQTVKKCTKCGEEKSLSDYSPHPRAPLGVQPRCKKCCAEANKARYHANLEKARQQSRENSARWSADNRERSNAIKAAWAEANKEKDRALKKAYALSDAGKQRRRELWADDPTRNKAWVQANPGKIREYARKYALKKYGLTPEQFRHMLQAQNGCCAICKKPPKPGRKLCVDHHHGTSKTRSLLCVACNAGIGNFREEPRLMMAAIDYLVEHGSPGILAEAA